MVEKGFELSEASNSPVIVDLRIRACHVHGTFNARANRAAAMSKRHRGGPADFNYERLSHPPATFRQEKLKAEVRMPAARRFIAEAKLNEVFDGDLAEVGVIVQGGLYNNVLRALQALGLADPFGKARVPILALNVVYPLVPEEIVAFCATKKAVLVIEEGMPEFIEQDIATTLRRNDVQSKLHGKDLLVMAGEYSTELLVQGLTRFLAQHQPRLDLAGGAQWLAKVGDARRQAGELLGGVPPRPPGFCIGCPERPVFAALKLAERETGRPHISGDIGCHAFATFEPFSMGNSILGYGMSLASAAGVGPMMSRRPLAVMGDGGFWHNGLLSGVASNLLNRGDAVLVIMQNGYASATGTQELISSPPKASRDSASATHADRTIENALQGMGVQWVKTVHTYDVPDMQRTLTEALTTEAKGLKVIVAEGECQLERQRRVKPETARMLSAGERVVKVKYGVDEDTCTGDHSCIRLSGCPTLTVKDNPDPLRRDPVATVIEGCVGCGLCGENAHAATLCPSFYRAEVVQNPSAWDRLMHTLRKAFVPA
jgi:indolepyruvate ferredoxin oxidoreductase alpha subunit